LVFVAVAGAELAQAQLIDEFHLMVWPVILGSGKKFFTDWGETKLQLDTAKAYKSRVVLLSYKVNKK